MVIFMKNVILFSILILLSACMSGKDSLKKIINMQGRTMGTTYSVKAVVHQDFYEHVIKGQIDQRLKEVNQSMSTYIKDSEISKLNNSPAGEFTLGKDFQIVLEHALNLAKKTEGVFDPTIGPLVNLWGFGPTGERKVPAKEAIEKARSLVGFEKINLVNNVLTKKVDGVYIDLSASAKGYGVDAIIEILKANGIQNAMVEIGGEIKTIGESMTRPWKIGVESPVEGSFERKVVKVVTLKDVALATSGNYRNFFKEGGKSYSHTIDFKSGSPARTSLASVSVISDTCMDADGQATAIMAMGTEKGYNYAMNNGIKAYLLYRDPKNPGKFKTLETKGFSEATRVK